MGAPDIQRDDMQAGSDEELEKLEQQIQHRTNELLQANQQLKKEIGERKRAELITRTLFRISDAVNTTNHLSELYASIHKILGDVIDLRNFYIALYNKQLRKVSFPYFVDQFDTDITYADQFSEDRSLTGEVILAQKPVVLYPADLAIRVQEERIIGTAPQVWIGFPLKIKDEVIGVMATQNYEDQHHFDAIDFDIFHSVSDQVAFAIARKRYEQAIVASEKKYRNIIESILDGYYEVDLDGNLTLVNEAMCEMIGYEDHELLGLNTSAYMSDLTVKKMNTALSAVLASEVPGETIELELQRRDGTLCYAETVMSDIRDEDNEVTGFRGIARDITERRNAEKSRQALEHQLVQSQRLESLGTLAGGIAHDFNNLLMGIQGRTSLMLDALGADDPHYPQLQSIEEYVESAAALTARLLGFARGGKYEVRPVNLNAQIEKSIQMFGRTRKEISIATNLQHELRPIEADANQIDQVLVNLLVNAGQAMEGGGQITITTRQVRLESAEAHFFGIQPGEYVQLTVSDSGKGMDEETMGKIFDPFFTTKEIGHGTGLGLAMVYGIIRNHSGAISVNSAIDQGTIFTIVLPASEKPPLTETLPAHTVEKGSETLLLVDDEPMIIEVGRELLGALGYSVLTAASGEEAAEIYSRSRNLIDVVIIDMIMPRMSGGELFDRLKALNPEVNVLLSSGYSIEGQAREILQRGCRGFIQKPFSLSQLSHKIREILS